jgi:hypothetical protein
MFTLFGILPLVKILLVAFVVIFGSNLIGSFFKISDSQNSNSSQFLIGVLVLVSLLAGVINKGNTIFIPFLFSLILLFKDHIKFDAFKIANTLSISLKIYAIFLVFFSIQLVREPYFSDQIVSATYNDFSFYMSTVQDIIKFREESKLATFMNYGIDVKLSLYHYFDLYLLSPVLFVGVPPLSGFVHWVMPFLFCMATVGLIGMVTNKINWYGVILAVVSLSLIGVRFADYTPIFRYSVFYFPKSYVVFIVFCLLPTRNLIGIPKQIVFLVITCLVINPLLLFASAPLLAGLIAFLLITKRVKFKEFFGYEIILIVLMFSAFATQFLAPSSNESMFLSFVKDFNLQEYLKVIFQKLRGHMGIIQHFPYLIVLLILSIYQLRKHKVKIHLHFVLTILLLCSGALSSTLLHIHFESFQLFSIVLAPAIAILFFYSSFILIKYSSKLTSVGLTLSFLFLGFLYFKGGSKIYLEARNHEPYSLNFIKQIKNQHDEINPFNALYFSNLNEDTPWIRTVPYLTPKIGYMHLFPNSHVLQPITSSFSVFNSYPAYALTSIGMSPFEVKCKELNIEPTYFDDHEYESVLKLFIEDHGINTFITTMDFVKPYWFNQMDFKEVILPTDTIGNHIVYML